MDDAQTLVADLAACTVISSGRSLWSASACTDLPDIVQEVYLRMLRVPNIESDPLTRGLSFHVAQHVVQQHTLRQTARPPSVELTQMLDIPSTMPDVDPVLATDAAQCVELLQDAIEELRLKFAPRSCSIDATDSHSRT